MKIIYSDQIFSQRTINIMASLLPGADVLNDKSKVRFDCGSVNGICLRDSLIFIAINNDKPHNGDLELFFLEIERQARAQKKTCGIICFFNERFRQWILRRDRWVESVITTPNGPELGVEYKYEETNEY